MAYFHTNVLDNQIKALPTVSTASGSIATFETDMTENLIEVVCDIQYQQSSGTPTPVNPLPITVYNSLNLSHSGADTSNPTVYNIPFGQTVAKGTLNASTGVLEITHGYKDLGTLPNWSYDSANQRFYSWNLVNTIKAPLSNLQTIDMICSAYSVYALGSIVNLGIAVSTTKNIYIKNTDYDNTTITDFIASLSGVDFVFELATPQIIQLSATQITALLENNIWCDTGDTEVKFLLSVGKAIS